MKKLERGGVEKPSSRKTEGDVEKGGGREKQKENKQKQHCGCAWRTRTHATHAYQQEGTKLVSGASALRTMKQPAWAPTISEGGGPTAEKMSAKPQGRAACFKNSILHSSVLKDCSLRVLEIMTSKRGAVCRVP